MTIHARTHQVPAVTEQMRVLSELQKSGLDLYLTGSRAFLTHRTDSDWDLFVAENAHPSAFLQDLGFEKLDTHHYHSDKFTISVLEHKEAKIHVQIVPSVEIKMAAQNLLKKHAFPRHLLRNKEAARSLWRVALAAVQHDPSIPEKDLLDVVFKHLKNKGHDVVLYRLANARPRIDLKYRRNSITILSDDSSPGFPTPTVYVNDDHFDRIMVKSPNFLGDVDILVKKWMNSVEISQEY